jgi:hypothetical protein
MNKNRIDANIRCPSCNGQLYPRVLVCDACGLKVEGEFVLNEFGALTPDELHFLRVFIYCEGRIRDMEAALGVSYPTVKAHLTSIRGKLNLNSPRFAGVENLRTGSDNAGPSEGLSAEEVLSRLEDGRISYKEALRLLKTRKRGEMHGDER